MELHLGKAPFPHMALGAAVVAVAAALDIVFAVVGPVKLSFLEELEDLPNSLTHCVLAIRACRYVRTYVASYMSHGTDTEIMNYTYWKLKWHHMTKLSPRG